MGEITSSRSAGLTIGVLSKETGCKIETIRYYERIGVMPDPPRTAGGHRIYTTEHLKRLGFVRRSRELGFTLDEVRVLLSLADGGEDSCEKVRQLTLDHADQIVRRMTDLKKMEVILRDMAARCNSDVVPDCPIIDALSAGGR
jgi:MerR family mercuric resistance operon transcriptional regulator|tara:strand:- start:82 stop:510 length:429 start_codon:yes stop_codon:yes gene_type:complete